MTNQTTEHIVKAQELFATKLREHKRNNSDSMAITIPPRTGRTQPPRGREVDITSRLAWCEAALQNLEVDFKSMEEGAASIRKAITFEWHLLTNGKEFVRMGQSVHELNVTISAKVLLIQDEMKSMMEDVDPENHTDWPELGGKPADGKKRK